MIKSIEQWHETHSNVSEMSPAIGDDSEMRGICRLLLCMVAEKKPKNVCECKFVSSKKKIRLTAKSSSPQSSSTNFPSSASSKSNTAAISRTFHVHLGSCEFSRRLQIGLFSALETFFSSLLLCFFPRTSRWRCLLFFFALLIIQNFTLSRTDNLIQMIISRPADGLSCLSDTLGFNLIRFYVVFSKFSVISKL